MAYDFMDKPRTVNAARNTLSVDGVLYQRLLEKLDESSNKGKPSAKRIYRRLGYAHPKLSLHVESDGHNARTLVVASRNLSQGGVSILHSNFMYNGTCVTVDLIDINGNIVSKYGEVTRCEHRGGRVHEIGIKFDEEIALRNFLSHNEDILLHARERVNPEDMNIKLLVYSEETEFSSLMRQFLLPSNLCYTFAKSTDETMEKFKEQDMLLFRVDSTAIAIPQLVRTIRDNGFENPIILVGHPKSSIDLHVVNACGADMVIPWPSDEQTMLCSIGEFIFNEWTPESLENIRSCISPETKQTLTMEMAKLGVTLDQQTRTDNQPLVHQTCQRIKMLAPLLGLSSMKATINEITEKTAVDGSIEPLASELSEISAICKALNSIAA
jgi:DNA-binding response OmpR family regulator